MNTIDKKGIGWFLFLTFFSTYLVEFVMMASGFSFSGIPLPAGQLVVAAVMFFPGIAAFIVRRFITREGFKDAGMRIGDWKYYLQVYLLMPALFVLIYGLTWVLVQGPDLSLQAFMKQFGVTESLPFPPLVLVVILFVSSITFTPFVNSIPAFGEEYGWRGYLLPKLVPLGTKKALVISSLIWGLWHMPLVLMGFKYGNHGLEGVVFFSVLLTFVGVYIGHLTLTSGSVILAAFAHGTLNAQAYGIWTVIFPDVNPLVGGISGVIGIGVFLILSLWVFRKQSVPKSRAAGVLPAY